MYDQKSDYAMNKHKKDTIVYISVNGPVFLTSKDFATETDFLKWKEWSDTDYRSQEAEGRAYYDNSIPLREELAGANSLDSIEDVLLGQFNENEREKRNAKLIQEAKSYLSPKQYLWLWLYYVKGLTLKEIACAEGVTHQNVSKVISRAKKKIRKHLQEVVAKMPLFL